MLNNVIPVEEFCEEILDKSLNKEWCFYSWFYGKENKVSDYQMWMSESVGESACVAFSIVVAGLDWLSN